MPSYSVSASEIKYASGSSWTSGKARQGVYSSTRYEGALNFAGLANFSFSNIAITGIQMRVTFSLTQQSRRSARPLSCLKHSASAADCKYSICAICPNSLIV